MALKHYNAASSKNSKLSKHAACGEFLQYYSVVVGAKRFRENPEFVFFFIYYYIYHNIMIFNMALLFH